MPTGFCRHDVLLVTGAGGLLGAELLRQCRIMHPDLEIIAVVREDCSEPVQADCTCLAGDLCERQTWDRVPPTVTHVCHLAAVLDAKAPDRDATLLHANTLPIARLIEAAHQWPQLRSIVYSSSISVYGATNERVTEQSPTQPESPYAAAKLAGEALLSCLRSRDIDVACLRMTSLYGPTMRRRGVLPVMLAAAVESNLIRVHGSGRRTQDFLHVADAARATLAAASHAANGIFNIGAGKSVSMTELAEHISTVCTSGQARVVHDRTLPDGPPGYSVDIDHARETFGFSPTVELAEGLLEMAPQVEA